MTFAIAALVATLTVTYVETHADGYRTAWVQEPVMGRTEPYYGKGELWVHAVTKEDAPVEVARFLAWKYKGKDKRKRAREDRVNWETTTIKHPHREKSSASR